MLVHALELLLLRLLHYLLLPPLPQPPLLLLKRRRVALMLLLKRRRVALMLMPRGVPRRSLGLPHVLTRRTPPRHRRRSACRGGG